MSRMSPAPPPAPATPRHESHHHSSTKYASSLTRFCLTQPRFFQVSFPLNLATQAPDRNLSADFNQQPQTCFYGSFFRTISAAPHGLADQGIIDVDGNSH